MESHLTGHTAHNNVIHSAHGRSPRGRPGPSCGILARPEPHFDGPSVSLPLKSQPTPRHANAAPCDVAPLSGQFAWCFVMHLDMYLLWNSAELSVGFGPSSVCCIHLVRFCASQVPDKTSSRGLRLSLGCDRLATFTSHFEALASCVQSGRCM
eukprot:350358-Chlamydomonas_euryale.AAC.1